MAPLGVLATRTREEDRANEIASLRSGTRSPWGTVDILATTAYLEVRWSHENHRVIYKNDSDVISKVSEGRCCSFKDFKVAGQGKRFLAPDPTGWVSFGRGVLTVNHCWSD